MTARRWLRRFIPALVGIAVLGLLYPKVTGTSWAATIRPLGTVTVPDAAGLAVVWFAGLCCYTVVLRAALPGLGLWQALTLNLGGSAVSNVLPFGGAAGIGLNFAMARSWGFRRASFAVFTAVTSMANVVAKLVLPVVAVAVVAVSGQPHMRPLVVWAEVEGGLLAVLGVLAWVSVTENPWVRGLRRLERWVLTRPAVRRAVPSGVAGPRSRVAALVRETRSTLRHGWLRICLGMAGYLALQAALLLLIFSVLHSRLAVAVVFAGFALERALTLAVATPGGVGIAQTGAAALMIALGGDPAIVAAAVLLYSVFTFFVEIPVGAVATLGWWVHVRLARRVPISDTVELDTPVVARPPALR